MLECCTPIASFIHVQSGFEVANRHPNSPDLDRKDSSVTSFEETPTWTDISQNDDVLKETADRYFHGYKTLFSSGISEPDEVRVRGIGDHGVRLKK